MKPETLEYKLRVYRGRLESLEPGEDHDFYSREIQDMERALRQQPSVWENLWRNLFHRPQNELYTSDLQEALDMLRTQDVVDMDRRWVWRKLDFVYYVKYRAN